MTQIDKPDSGWIGWAGGECPVDGDTLVEVRLRRGIERVPNFARTFQWGRFPETANLADIGYEIIAYRTVQP